MNQYPQNPGYDKFEDQDSVPRGQPVEGQNQPYSQQAQNVQPVQQQFYPIAQQQQPQNYNYPPLPFPHQQPQQAMQMYAPYNVQPNIIMPSIPTTRQSQQLYCDQCKQIIYSRVVYQSGTGTYIAGAVIAALGCWLGCCFIPCTVNDCQDAQHLCSRCGVVIGAKRFLFD